MNEEKITFDKTKELRIIVNDIFTEIDTKLKILTNLYKDLVKTHVDKNYRLGIDSFHFQNKLMQMEYDNMKNISGFIDNRIYCEYYKLLKMLYNFIKNEIKDKTIIDKLLIMHKQYPIYKDLEPSKLYEFDIYLNMCVFSSLIYLVVAITGTDVNFLRLTLYFSMGYILIWPIIFGSVPIFKKNIIKLSFVIIHLVFYFFYIYKFSNLNPYIFNNLI